MVEKVNINCLGCQHFTAEELNYHWELPLVSLQDFMCGGGALGGT